MKDNLLGHENAIRDEDDLEDKESCSNYSVKRTNRLTGHHRRWRE